MQDLVIISIGAMAFFAAGYLAHGVVMTYRLERVLREADRETDSIDVAQAFAIPVKTNLPNGLTRN